MIAKNKKGKSFGGCVRYVMNEGAEVLAAEGVLADDAASITRDFAIQRSGRPEIKQPVGHIAVAFSPDDSPRLTNDFMLTLAHEYMTEMGIGNTQYIVVRHHNTDHDHFHIVYNRIDNDLKLISVNNDYRRNVAACKKLKDCHGLTYGTGKEKVNRPKLMGADKVKYQIHDEIAANITKCATYSELEKRLKQAGISVQYKYRRGAVESPENIQGVSFEKNGITFKGSDIDRKFSHANLSKVLQQNMNATLSRIMEPKIPSEGTDTGRAAIQPEQTPSRVIQLSKPPEPQKQRQSTIPRQPQEAVNPSSELSRMQTQQPSIQPEPPRPAKKAHIIAGAQMTDEQLRMLKSGECIFVEGLEKKDGSGYFSAYLFMNDDRNRVYSSRQNPDDFVKYGKYEMCLRDKILVEKGHITRATVKWWSGGTARPYLWKENLGDTDYKESWSDPRAPKEQQDQERQVSADAIRRPPAVNRTIPPPRTVPSKRTVPPPTKGPKMRR
ncbi:MAG: relaxase/mobilization nuclease domain-containing protein [Rikenellaceae bacterium]|jgi:hypothetical protein|nr:relaxase/mobilization nuclease domain-containing protein [Rikenellaceae bacterium]